MAKPTQETSLQLSQPPVQASPGSLVKGVLRTALDKAPIVGVITKLLRETVEAHREERLAYWSSCLAADDADTFAAKLDGALHGPEASTVRSSVVESARAAVDAIADDVVPTIAMLTNSFLKDKAPDRPTFRTLLSILKGLEAQEHRALRDAVHRMLTAPDMPPDYVQTLIQLDGTAESIARAIHEGVAADGTRQVWVWQTNSSPPTILTLGEVAPRLVAALEPLDGDLHHSFTEAQRPTNKRNYSHRLVSLLASIMPQ